MSAGARSRGAESAACRPGEVANRPFCSGSARSARAQPGASAEKSDLIRRATFDLTGLPPTPDEGSAFLADKSAGAFAKVVDRLLASPRYGERWDRYWLDIVRYSDDHLNSTQDEPYPNAWRYRDWVIQSFNDDMPYDLFVEAQIAGDLVPTEDRANWSRAWGFMRSARNFRTIAWMPPRAASLA
jgi:hypothetical protein